MINSKYITSRECNYLHDTDPALFMDLSTNLNVRIRAVLHHMNIKYMFQLIQLTELELYRNKNLGRKSMNLIKDFLDEYGFVLNTRFVKGNRKQYE